MAKYNRPGAREDFLFGSYRAAHRSFAAGALVAERAGPLLPNASPEETAKIAESLRVDRSRGGILLRFTGPDGRRHTLALAADGTVGWNNRSVRPQ